MTADPTARTERWLRRVVVGLNLCPFAAPVLDAGGLEIVVSDAADADTLTADLDQALRRVAEQPAGDVETVLLVIERLLIDFDDFVDYLAVADALIDARGLRGAIQIASFHPQFVFDGEATDDPANAGHRAPYPTLHLLREASVSRAVSTHPDVESIPARNAERLRRLGAARVIRLLDD